MKWIKASERLPENENRYYVKMENGFMSVSYFNGKRFEHPEYVSDKFEWLDESPTEIWQQGVERIEKLCKMAFREALQIDKPCDINNWWAEFKLQNNL